MARPRRWSTSATCMLPAIAVAVAGWGLHVGAGRDLDAQVVNPPEGPLAIESPHDFAVFANVLENAGVTRFIDKELRSGPCTSMTFERVRWFPFQPTTYSAEFEFGVAAATRVAVAYVRDPLVSPPASPPDTIVSARVTLPRSPPRSLGRAAFANRVEFGFLVFAVRDAATALNAPLKNAQALRRVGVERVSGSTGQQTLVARFDYSDGQGTRATITVTGEYYSPSTYVVTSVR